MLNLPATHQPNFSQSLLLCLLPLIAFAGVAYPISDWLVDDALISFAYARSLANGAGFVSQPGMAPVEGFSNPLWTLLFVPAFWLSSDLPLWIAKFFGHALSFGTFFFGFQIVLRLTRSPLFGVLAMTALALNTSFVVWNVSGLENALYAFEIVAIAYLGLLALDGLSSRVAVIAGLLAAAAALTRPDGIVFVLLWPGALAAQILCDRRIPAEILRTCAAYITAAALPLVSYKAMALVYFGSLFPNTYYTKGGPDLETILGILALNPTLIDKAIDLLAAPFGFGWITLGIVVTTLAVCFVAKRSVAPLVYLTGSTAMALLVYILLPWDWMPEFRFGTPFMVLFYPTVFSLVWVANSALPKINFVSRQFPALLLIAVMLASSILVHQFRIGRFYDDPTTPFTDISNRYGERFNRAARILGVEKPSFLLQDVGATLFYSELEIYDLAGLTDATIARTLRKDHARLHDYIFNQVKPTFIVHYAYSTLAADLESSPQFREQYVPIRENVDAIASEDTGRTVYSGTYVRKDLIAGRSDLLEQARAVLFGSP